MKRSPGLEALKYYKYTREQGGGDAALYPGNICPLTSTVAGRNLMVFARQEYYSVSVVRITSINLMDLFICFLINRLTN
jgi:hypothetical protein